MGRRQSEDCMTKRTNSADRVKNVRKRGRKNYRMAGAFLTAAISVAGALGIRTAAAVPEDLWQYTEGTDEDGNIFYDFKEVEVILPESWEGKYGMTFGEDYVNFYHRSSREKIQAAGWGNGGGTLFTVHYSQNYDFTEYLPNYSIVDSGQMGVYYVTLPTDVQGYPDDEQVWNEWSRMSGDLEWVRDQVSVIGSEDGPTDTLEGLASEADAYILADSSARYLTVDDLYGMDADELQMAINEIYARHHRKFVLKDVQEYFNSKSWYNGTVEAENFDPSVMNLYEGQNIELLLEQMKQLKKNQY